MENKKIVFIDSNDFFRKLYKKKLKEKKVKFFEAEEGNKGWELIKKEKPDLVVSEVVMPGWDGFKIAKEMNNDEELSDVPIIILTNLTQDADRKSGEKLGVFGYFIKQQCNLSDVMDKIEEALQIKDEK